MLGFTVRLSPPSWTRWLSMVKPPLKCPPSTKDLGFPPSSRKVFGNWLWLKCVSHLERGHADEMLDFANLDHTTSPGSGCKASLTQTAGVERGAWYGAPKSIQGQLTTEKRKRYSWQNKSKNYFKNLQRNWFFSF